MKQGAVIPTCGEQMQREVGSERRTLGQAKMARNQGEFLGEWSESVKRMEVGRADG